ncbi:MAG: hypothetical protein RSD36_15825 [Terrisporobacter sp.]
MNFKRVIISTICILSFMFVSILPSYAYKVNLYDVYKEADEPTEIMEYITNSKSNLSITSKGVASILCTVSGNAGITKTEIKASLQRKVNNKWTTVSTWYSNGSRTCTLSKKINVSKGYQWRVLSTVKAFKGSKSETKTITSNISKW